MTATELSPNEFHKIQDMALVTFLKIQGHTPQRTEWSGSTCYWYFRVTEGLMSEIASYQEDKALVNPKEFNRIFANTRTEFYENRQAS